MSLRKLKFLGVFSRRGPRRSCSSSSFKSGSSGAMFYEVSGLRDTSNAVGSGVVGEVTDNMVDLKKTRPGDVISVPYELTISQAFRDFWQSAFYSHERINTSTPFARRLGLQDQVVPFSMMLFLTSSMTHAYDNAKIEVSYKHAKYHWPGHKIIISVNTSSTNNRFSRV